MNILVIHGFNSAPGSKSKDLEKAFPNTNVITPQLLNKPLQDIEVLSEIVSSYKNLHIVGTSLGGFYAMYLMVKFKDREDISFYIINPSYTPYDNFKTKIGSSFSNYKLGTVYTVCTEFVEELGVLQKQVHSSPINLPNAYYYFGSKDIILNYSKIKDRIRYYSTPYNILESDQDHRHSDISKVVNQIEINSLEI